MAYNKKIAREKARIFHGSRSLTRSTRVDPAARFL
jgi:hypothetical protein